MKEKAAIVPFELTVSTLRKEEREQSPFTTYICTVQRMALVSQQWGEGGLEDKRVTQRLGWTL